MATLVRDVLPKKERGGEDFRNLLLHFICMSVTSLGLWRVLICRNMVEFLRRIQIGLVHNGGLQIARSCVAY